MPPWIAESRLSNLYWHLRAVRSWDTAGRRRFYRYIEAEKQRLIAEGIDAEEVRLFCRYSANPFNKAAKERLLAYVAQGRFELR